MTEFLNTLHGEFEQLMQFFTTFAENVRSKTLFRPEGTDVHFAKILLTAQLIDLFVFKFVLGLAQTSLFINILQVALSVPLISLSSFLFLRFKLYFSASTCRNIKIITILMLFENGINIGLRLMIALKSLTSHSLAMASALFNLFIPIIFEAGWVIIFLEFVLDQ
jgi:hypothetical protein